MARNILITGGAGFIGSNFIHYWLASHPEDRIVNLDKLTYAGNLESLKEIAENPNYKFIKGDICNYALVDRTVKDNNIDTIIHFAAETHVDRSIEDPAVFIKTNVIGTQVLLDVAKDNGNVRFHHVSTDEVFGHLPLDRPEVKFHEDTPYDPRSPYSASKAGSDHLVRAYHATYDLPVTISNCSNNFGPFHFPEKLIPLVITRALNDEQIPVYGDGLQVRDWIHVNDHNRGVGLILEKGKLGETYLLGGDGERTNIYMVKKILEILNKPESLIVHVGDRKGHDKRYAIDYTKAKTELGFHPEKNVDQWLETTVKWFMDNKWWWEPLKPEADKMAERYLRQ